MADNRIFIDSAKGIMKLEFKSIISVKLSPIFRFIILYINIYIYMKFIINSVLIIFLFYLIKNKLKKKRNYIIC